MRSLRIFSIAVITVFFFISLNCTIKYYDTNKLINDYTTDGFLDTDHYQVIVKGKPDADAKGLVAARESSLNDAKTRIEDTVLNNLVEYNYQYYLDKLNIKDEKKIQNVQYVKQDLRKQMLQFYSFGYIAFEYYNPDNSAVIVYRIFKDNLLKKIESIKPDIKLIENKEK